MPTYYTREDADKIVTLLTVSDNEWTYKVERKSVHRDLYVICVEDEDGEFLGYLP